MLDCDWFFLFTHFHHLFFIIIMLQAWQWPFCRFWASVQPYTWSKFLQKRMTAVSTKWSTCLFFPMKTKVKQEKVSPVCIVRLAALSLWCWTSLMRIFSPSLLSLTLVIWCITNHTPCWILTEFHGVAVDFIGGFEQGVTGNMAVQPTYARYYCLSGVPVCPAGCPCPGAPVLHGSLLLHHHHYQPPSPSTGSSPACATHTHGSRPPGSPCCALK